MWLQQIINVYQIKKTMRLKKKAINQNAYKIYNSNKRALLLQLLFNQAKHL